MSVSRAEQTRRDRLIEERMRQEQYAQYMAEKGDMMEGGAIKSRGNSGEELQVAKDALAMWNCHKGTQWELVEIESVSTQVVQGTRYKMEVVVRNGEGAHERKELVVMQKLGGGVARCSLSDA